MVLFHRGISRLKIGLFFFTIMLLFSTTQLSCITTTTNPSTESTTTQQIIDHFMQSAPVNGHSIVNYTNVLSVGDNVIGYVQLAGEWELAGDWATPWEFNAFGPNGEVMDHVILTYNLVDLDPFHYFDFTALSQGVYTIEVTHISTFPRDLYMEIQPSGWELSTN